jgi:hypothetical protein
LRTALMPSSEHRCPPGAEKLERHPTRSGAALGGILAIVAAL